MVKEFDVSKIPDAHLQPYGFYKFTLSLVKAASKLLLNLDTSKITGREFVPRNGGFIFASNHSSHFDPPVLAVASPRQLTYLAKVELFKNPLFAKLISSLGAFPIQRGKGDLAAFNTAVEFLKKGHGLVVFPEGTRTTTGKLGRIRPGAAKLAINAQVPILPVYIKGTYDAFPKGGRIKPHPVFVTILPPLFPETTDDTLISCAELTRKLENALKQLENANNF